MGTMGPRRWVLSPLDRRSHVLPADGRGRPIGTVVGVCGHVMACSAPTGPRHILDWRSHAVLLSEYQISGAAGVRRFSPALPAHPGRVRE
ncbi:MAG: hypothetical protein ACRDTE_13550, partial [Pseudonocardiaceae bacterium]